MKRKITVTTGSRSEYGILRPVLQQISKSKKLELFLIVTGMHLSKKHKKHLFEKLSWRVGEGRIIYPGD